MTENPDGNVVDSTYDEDGGSTAISRRRLKNMPRSELWYAHELHCLATTSSLRSTTAGRNDDGDGKMEAERGDPCDDDGPDDVEGEAYEKDRDESSAEFLVGKSVTLYNNLDNEYHVGRIVDWRACTVYPRPLTFPGLATRDRNGSICVDITAAAFASKISNTTAWGRCSPANSSFGSPPGCKDAGKDCCVGSCSRSTA